MRFPLMMNSEFFPAGPAVGQILKPGENVFRNNTGGFLRVNRIGFAGADAAGVDYGPYDVATNNRPEWSIRFGQTAVTPGFVPVPATTWDPSGSDYAGAQVAFSKPVYLAPGDRLDLQLRFNAAYAASPYLFAECTPIDGVPDEVYTPVMLGWESPEFAWVAGTIAALDTDVPVSTFFNDSDEPLFVERMIGRLGLNEYNYPKRIAIADALIDLQLHDGTKITRDPTPLASLFDVARQSWLMNFKLPKQGYVKATLSGSVPSVDQGDLASIRFYLGMLGYRRVV